MLISTLFMDLKPREEEEEPGVGEIKLKELEIAQMFWE